MAEYMPAPSFNFGYTAGTMDLGKDYALGMEAGTKAGESLGKGITQAADVMNRRQAAGDTLTAMQKSGMLRADQYAAIAGKSLGAQETMIGMYANQWIAQQAQARELQKLGYGANLEVWKQHQALLDEIAKLKETRPQTLPMNVQNQPNQQVAPRALPPNATPPVQRAQPVQQPGQYAIGPTWTGALPQVYKSGSMPINGKPAPGILVPSQQSAPLGGQPVDWTFHPYG